MLFLLFGLLHAYLSLEWPGSSSVMTSRSVSSWVIYHTPPCHVITADCSFGNKPIILQPFLKLICSTVHTNAGIVTGSVFNVTFVSPCTQSVLSQ